MDFLISQLLLFLRMVVAGACGIAIGYERQSRQKVAGTRTHLIVCLGSCLIMIVSKYGFADVLRTQGIGLDPARIAAQIVSGVGFLGAGIIFTRKREISGLTTAAGVWTTAGVGMALGAGMYFIGVSAAVLVILVQVLLHKNWKWVKNPVVESMALELEGGEDTLNGVRAEFAKYHAEILSMRLRKTKSGHLYAELFVKLPGQEDMHAIAAGVSGNPGVLSVEV